MKKLEKIIREVVKNSNKTTPTQEKIAKPYYKEGDVKRAIEHYEQNLVLDSSDIDIYFKLAQIYRQHKEYDKALEYYQVVLRLRPLTHQLYEIMLYMGDIYRDTKKNKEAINCYKKAIKINNKRDEKERNYYLYLKSGHLSATNKTRIKYYEKAIEVGEKGYEAYYSLGTTYVNKKDDVAIELFKKALKLHPYYAQAYVNMGVAYENLNKEEKALKCYTKAVSVNPTVFQAYINLFSLYEDRHEYLPDEIERTFIENFKENKNIYVMYVVMGYLVDIYHGKEIDLDVFEKEYRDAGMECCTFKAKKILKNTRKKDKKSVSKLLEVIKIHTKVLK